MTNCHECMDEIVGEARSCIDCDRPLCKRCYSNYDGLCTDCWEDNGERQGP